MMNIYKHISIAKPSIFFAIITTVLLVFIQCLQGDVISLLRYENTINKTGEWWRLLSAHFIHLGWTHLLLNLVGFWILLFLFQNLFTPVILLIYFLLLGVGISLCLFLFSPDVAWYVGMSGMIHGLFVIGALRSFQTTPWLSITILSGIAVKLVWEQYYADVYAMEFVIGGRVIYDAHLYGAIAGALLTTVMYLRRFKHISRVR